MEAIGELQIDNVSSQEDFETLYKIYTDCFADDDLVESREDFFQYWEEGKKDGSMSYILFKMDGKSVGFRQVYHDSELGVGYVPWGGIIKDYQGRGLYPRFVELTEAFLRLRNIKVVIQDCERCDPEDTTSINYKRIKMFKSLGYRLISDNEIRYFRPGWGEIVQERIDKYYLGFKIISEDSPVRIVDDSISIQDFRFLFYCMMFFETGLRAEVELRSSSEVIDSFYRLVDDSKYSRISLLT